MTKLQTYRKRAGFTQPELAYMADLSLRTLQDYEQGRKPLEKAAAVTVLRLAGVLGCTVEQLISEEVPE